MPDLTWLPDPAPYLVDLRPIGRRRTGRINNPYSQWILGHGARFNLTEEYRSPWTDPQDFTYLLAFRNLDDDGPPGRPQGFLSSTTILPPTAPPPARVRKGLFIGGLPVRRHSVSPQVPSTAAEESDAPAEEETWAPSLPPGIDPAKLVIMGVMDDAIHIGHHRFRDAMGRSRVDAAWIQDGRYEPGPGPVGPGAPLHRQFGHLWSGPEITAAIAQNPNDDDALMRALDLIADAGEPYRPTPLRFTNAHGTHIADLAAGYDPAEDAINRRIIAVQLPVYASQDTSGASLLASVIAGSGFIFDRALAMSASLGVPIPVVLNFSYGFGGGLRDGEHVIERAIRAQADAYRDAVAALPGCVAPPAVYLLPAGNEHLSATHSRGGTAEGGVASLDAQVRVQPDSRASSYVELWVSRNTSRIDLTITAPDGGVGTIGIDLPANPPDPGAFTLGNDFVLAEDAGGGVPVLDTIVARVSVDLPAAYPRADAAASGWRVLLALAPSQALVAGNPTSAHGIWHLNCQATGDGAGIVRSWVQRNDDAMGFGLRGRQAYFDDALYQGSRFDKLTDIAVRDTTDSDVRRDGTVSGIASRPDPVPSGAEEVTVGAMRWDIAGPMAYTAAGYEPQNYPHVLAVGDTSRVLGGVLSATNRGMSKSALGGTSVSTPLVARMIADAVEDVPASGYGGFSAIAEIQGSAVPPDRPGPDNPELASNRVVRVERSEFGTIDPTAAMEKSVTRGNTRKWSPP